jgi:hypothetical protein
MAHNSGSPRTRSRREMLTAALGGIAGFVAARLSKPDAASAAAGQPVIMGNANSAGTTNTSLATASTGSALLVTQNGTGTALRGSAVGAGSIAGFFTASNGTGISGVTGAGGSYGVFAQNNGAAGAAGALRAAGGNNDGVVATTSGTDAYAVQGTALQGVGLWGKGINGVTGLGTQNGVQGTGNVNGVFGMGIEDGSFGGRFEAPGPTGAGVWSESTDGTGVGAVGGAVGIYASGATNAGVFDGDVQVNGDLAVTGTISKGGGTFRIDHPLDPANKYLLHSFVESPDMLNVYSGTVTTDGDGHATVELPRYFAALNRDVRYQLTVIGATFAQAIVSREVKGGRFSIRTDRPSVKVSWQVTGIRQDTYAREHPIVVEQDKPTTRKGTAAYPQPMA